MVAQVLQLKLGTTKTILYRALKKLKQALEQEGKGERSKKADGSNRHSRIVTSA